MGGSVGSRGGNFLASFKAAGSITSASIGLPVDLSAAGTVRIALSSTAQIIGVIKDASQGGANSSILVDLFIPTKVGQSAGSIAAGAKISTGLSGGGFITNSYTTTVLPIGVAVTAASQSGEFFEFIPFLPYSSQA